MDAYDKDIWDAGRKVVSAIWDALGYLLLCYYIMYIKEFKRYYVHYVIRLDLAW